MPGIYGHIVEHPEYPIEDERHFSVTIKAHAYEDPGLDPLTLRQRRGCERCGFPKFDPERPGRLHPLHKIPGATI